MTTRRDRKLRWNGRKRRRFDEVYGASFSLIYVYCFRRTRTREDAEDAVAETFLVAWRRFHELASADHPTAWLYAVARRVLANQRKLSERRERTTERAWALTPSMALDDPAHETLHALKLERVLEAMIELSATDRELLTLAAFEQLSYSEIAGVLDIPIETTKSRLYRARQRLQDRFEQLESPTEQPTVLEGDGPHV